MKKLISFIFCTTFITPLFAQPLWVSEARQRNVELSKKLDWKELNKLDNRERSIKIAVVGSGNNISDFSEYIDINEKEIPNNGIDDDYNGYVDDYYGYNLSTKSGVNLNDDLNKHETHVASLSCRLD